MQDGSLLMTGLAQELEVTLLQDAQAGAAKQTRPKNSIASFFHYFRISIAICWRRASIIVFSALPASACMLRLPAP